MSHRLVRSKEALSAQTGRGRMVGVVVSPHVKGETLS